MEWTYCIQVQVSSLILSNHIHQITEMMVADLIMKSKFDSVAVKT